MYLWRGRKSDKLGRYSVGLGNRANDCFANSGLQGLSSLLDFYTYLDEMTAVCSEIKRESDPEVGDKVRKQVDNEINGKGPGKESEEGAEKINEKKIEKEGPEKEKETKEVVEYGRLTKAMHKFIIQLNEPITSPKTLSPWPLLNVIERIYKSRLSRNQHDAHELLHLILETLFTEHEALEKHLKETNEQVAEFPFSGSTIDRITCSKCGYSPPSNASSFLVLSLMVPQKRSTSLASMLSQYLAVEYIQDYGCVSCRLHAAVQSISVPPELRQEFQNYVDDISKLPQELEDKLPRDMSSAIAKGTQFAKLPRILCIHLSRSIYGGYGASRNSCKVSVSEELTLDEDARGSTTGQRSSVHYKLKAMVRHRGTHYAGHYECFKRKNLEFWVVHHKQRNGPNGLSGASTPMKSSIISMNSLSSNGSRPHLSSSTGHSEAESESSSSKSSVQDSAHDSPGGLGGSGAPSDNGALPFPRTSSPLPASISGPPTPPIISTPGSFIEDDSTSAAAAALAEIPPSTHQWWKISDDKVTECNLKEVLREESGAYLLFYERDDLA